MTFVSALMMRFFAVEAYPPDVEYERMPVRRQADRKLWASMAGGGIDELKGGIGKKTADGGSSKGGS